ncbi:MAG: chemotaxis protein CheW [Pyrinomonadaceae bacterium]|nr:chemotaxis protein CheW [Pyrinomonadaceae bacterium]
MTDETSSGRPPTLSNTREAGSFCEGASREQPHTTRKLQLLSVGSLVLGVFEDEIATIAEWRRPTPLPQAPSAVLGVVSIQGRMLTVLDPLSLFGETTTRLGFPTGILVALRGDEQIALAIEVTGATLDLAMEDIQPPSDHTNGALCGIVQYGDQLVKVVQVKGLFPTALRGHDRRRRRF